jgi:Na+/H+-translocating membrane pyrophosphatase
MGNLQWGDIVLYSIPALGLLGILFMAIKSAWVTKQDAGDENMQELAGYIAKGAMAFLKAEWKVLAYFVVIAGALLAWSGTLVETSSPVIAISFIFGAVLSALAGYIGMNIATKANVRTTQAARTSLSQALKVSFTGGSVMGHHLREVSRCKCKRSGNGKSIGSSCGILFRCRVYCIVCTCRWRYLYQSC